MYRVGCLFTLFLSANAREFALKCPASSSSTTTGRLRTEILCDYDSSIRPVKNHTKATNVSFKLLLKYFNYDHFSHSLSVDAWFTVYWTDQHLKWKPQDYDGIKNIYVSSTYDIWTPDISIYNMKDQSSDPKAIGDTMCIVSYLGTVICVPSLHFDALCVPDLKYYPYDVQKCTVRFGSWVQNGEEVNLTLVETMVDANDLEDNGEWELISAKHIRHRGNYSCCPNSTYPSIDVIFEIKRHTKAHVINVVLPLVVCILLTITTMAMSPLNRDRLVIGCVNLIAHVYHSQNVSYMVPVSGDNIPNILRITRDSALLAGVSIIATVFLKSIMKNKTVSPNWMSGTVSILTGSKPGQWMLLADNSLKGVAKSRNLDDGATIIPDSDSISHEVSGDWFIFGKFLDVTLFIIYLLVYFVIIVIS